MKLEVKLTKKYRPSHSIDFWKHVTNFILSALEVRKARLNNYLQSASKISDKWSVEAKRKQIGESLHT